MTEIAVQVMEEDITPDDAALAPPEGLTRLGQTAHALIVALETETRLARNGDLPLFNEAIQVKRQAQIEFYLATSQQDPALASRDDRAALRRLVSVAEENALVLDAVRTTVEDIASRLRTALTSAADPGTYGPKGKVLRHALAAQYDTKI